MSLADNIVRALMANMPPDFLAKVQQFMADAHEMRDGIRGARAGFQEAVSYTQLEISELRNEVAEIKALLTMRSADQVGGLRPNGLDGEDHGTV